MKTRNILTSLLLASALVANAQESKKLSGEVIGTEYSVDYSNGQASTTVNTKNNAFDGDLSTYFASYDRSFTWCGLDLGTKHIITRIGWSPRNDGVGESRVQLAIFEGANQPDFSDAVPLYMNDKYGKIGEYHYADIDVTRGFRYVRYIGPNNARCNIAEVEFHGYEGEGTDERFYRPTKLPLVVIHVANNEEPYDKVNELVCSTTLIPADGSAIKTHSGLIRLRGNASIGFPKKPYRIKFDKKQHVFDSPAKARKWTLINNFGDKTLMRNILAFEISRRLGLAYTPYCQPVDVMVNGEYKGCYQLCDQIDIREGRVEIYEMDSTDISGNALTGGYMLEVDAYADSEDCYFYSNRGNPVTIKYPDSDDITPEQLAYIKAQFNLMESRVFASNFMTENGYRGRLDIESFLKHFLVGELAGNTDTYWSVYMYKNRGDDKFYVGPVWDFDIAFENDNRSYPICEKYDFLYNTVGSCAGNMKNFVNRIMRNDSRTADDLLDMWTKARWSGLNAESMNEYVDQTADLLWESQQLNFMRWPILDQMLHQNWQASGSYEGEVDIVKNYITQRFAWMDERIGFDPTSIDHLGCESNQQTNDNRIYSIDGTFMGTNLETLPKGIYIRNGKKIIKK